MNAPAIKATNTILYCQKWAETVAFYRKLGLPATFESDWFVEFQLAPGSHLSVANEQRATIKSSNGAGMTLTWQVEDIEAVWQFLVDKEIAAGPIKQHSWGARLFHFFDPEGHRLEVWAPAQN